MNRYFVMADDNFHYMDFHYMDEDERSECEGFETILDRDTKKHVPSVAEVSALHTTQELLNLMDGPSPADPRVVAILLERWFNLDPKPVAQGKIAGIGIKCSVFFLEWLVESAGRGGFQVLGATNLSLARRIAEDFLSHANYQISFYEHGSGGGSIGFGIRANMACRWKVLKQRVLGYGGIG